ncbi:hypothetical protein AB434_2499 [Heyndrickxia coagulans]|nr:hypothetical protein AB434_2499 [Heyndrickxia coagulans]
MPVFYCRFYDCEFFNIIFPDTFFPISLLKYSMYFCLTQCREGRTAGPDLFLALPGFFAGGLRT